MLHALRGNIKLLGLAHTCVLHLTCDDDKCDRWLPWQLLDLLEQLYEQQHNVGVHAAGVHIVGEDNAEVGGQEQHVHGRACHERDVVCLVFACNTWKLPKQCCSIPSCSSGPGGLGAKLNVLLGRLETGQLGML